MRRLNLKLRLHRLKLKLRQPTFKVEQTLALILPPVRRVYTCKATDDSCGDDGTRAADTFNRILVDWEVATNPDVFSRVSGTSCTS
eukprot:4984446-Amphidinium_carterae.1